MQLPTWLCGGGYDNYWFLGRWRRRTQNLPGSASLIADYSALTAKTVPWGVESRDLEDRRVDVSAAPSELEEQAEAKCLDRP